MKKMRYNVDVMYLKSALKKRRIKNHDRADVYSRCVL